MTDFRASYLGRLRSIVGGQPLVVSGVRVVVVNEAGEILLQLRGDFKDTWGLPGGSLEYGEQASACAIRETLEETGLELHELSAFGHSSDPKHEIVEFGNGDICHFQVLLFFSSSFSGELTCDGNETLKLKWLAPERMVDVKTLPNMLATVEAFLNHKKSGKFQIL